MPVCRPCKTILPIAITLLVFAALPLTASAGMNSHLTLTLNGTLIEGDSTISSLGRANTIECLSFSQAGFSDTSRLPPRRSYRPITIRKRIDRSSPLLMQGWAQNEAGSAVFRFYRASPAGDGTTQQYYTIELVNARITAISTTQADTLDPGSSNLPELEIVSFEFDQIRYTDEVNGTTFVDDLTGGL